MTIRYFKNGARKVMFSDSAVAQKSISPRRSFGFAVIAPVLLLAAAASAARAQVSSAGVTASPTAQQAAAGPTFSPAGGVHRGPLTVKLASATAGAVLRYTVDGTTPSATAGTVYSGPFTVTGRTTVRAVAYAKGLTVSSEVSSTYLVIGPPRVTSVSPASRPAGTPVTISGAGFGPVRLGGTVWLGTAYGKVLSWSDRRIVAMAAPYARSGKARVRAAGVWSNTVPFQIVPHSATAVSSSGSGPRIARFGARPQDTGTVTLVPASLSMVVGDKDSLQALDANGQPATGLTWTSSNTNVVSLSADDPPVLTAAAAGEATITAGGGSADVTVFAGALPVGTVTWSNPGDGSGVYSVLPAVPGPSGVADVFAFQGDGTVQAVTSDGHTAWSANPGQSEWVLPDFLGGLVVQTVDPDTGIYSILKLDGITGQSHLLYSSSDEPGPLAVHPDGTVFAVEGGQRAASLVGIDPLTGSQKFSIPLPQITDGVSYPQYGLIIAGDGYAYLSVYYPQVDWSPDPPMRPILLRVDTTGAYGNIDISSLSGHFDFAMISNADQGVLLSSATFDPGTWAYIQYLTVTTGTTASLVTGPQIPGVYGTVNPVLQLQDGSFAGTISTDDYYSYLVAFDGSGHTLWTLPGNWEPQIATDDGGVIATNLDTGAAGTFDRDGNAMGQLASLPVYSWSGNAYQQAGSVEQISDDFLFVLYEVASSFWALPGGNYSHNGTAYASIRALAANEANSGHHRNEIFTDKGQPAN